MQVSGAYPPTRSNDAGFEIVISDTTMKNTMLRNCCYFPLMWLQSAVALI